MNRLKELLRLLTVIPLLIVLAGINFYEDPSNIFHDASKEIANAILEGKEAYFGSGNGNERKVKQYLIEGMPKDIECVTIGPSLSLGIRRSNVGTDSYYNLSASSLNFNDIMAEFALNHRRNAYTRGSVRRIGPVHVQRNDGSAASSAAVAGSKGKTGYGHKDCCQQQT